MRIWITGVGMVTGLGAGSEAGFKAMLAGQGAIGPITLFEVGAHRSQIASEVRSLSVEAVAPSGQADRWSRTDALALLAAREALTQARLDPRRSPTALVVGGSTAGMFEVELELARMASEPGYRPPLGPMRTHLLGSTAERLAEALGPFHRSRSLCGACASGAQAVAIAAGWIGRGRARRVLAGASDALCRLTFAGFDALRAMDTAPCRPFDAGRAGMSLGEGAAFLLLEADDEARSRGVEPLAELGGWALGSEAVHITQPEEDGSTVRRLLARALDRAGAEPAQVDYVQAHGTGTDRNDSTEAEALRAVLGERFLVSSSKGQVGHTLAAAGAVGAVVAALAVARDQVPPTGGLAQPDPRCPGQHVIGQGRGARVDLALCNAFGFGGLDAVLALRKPGLGPEPAFARAPSVLVTGATFARFDDLKRANTLDPMRARRLPKLAQLSTLAGRTLLGSDAPPDPPERTGLVLSSLFADLTENTAYCARSRDLGGRSPNLSLFPVLVPSSVAALTAIYLRLRGPCAVVSDESASALAAILTALERLEEGDADRMLAGGVELWSELIGRAYFAPGEGPASDPPGDGAALLLAEAEAAALARGASPLARILGFDQGAGPLAAGALPPCGSPRSLVFSAGSPGALAPALAGSAWAAAPLRRSEAGFGDHGALTGAAAVEAAQALGRGEADEALVLQAGPSAWAWLRLARLQPAETGAHDGQIQPSVASARKLCASRVCPSNSGCPFTHQPAPHTEALVVMRTQSIPRATSAAALPGSGERVIACVSADSPTDSVASSAYAVGVARSPSRCRPSPGL